MLRFLKSKTVWAAVGLAISRLIDQDGAFHTDPQSLITAGSAILAGVGVKHAVDKSGPSGK